MSSYAIELILTGKNQVKSMLSSASSDIKKATSDAVSGNNKIAESSNKASQSYQKVGTSASSAYSKVKSSASSAYSSITSGASKATSTNTSLFSKISSTASSAFSKVKSVGSSGFSSLVTSASKFGSTASTVFGKVSSAASSAFGKIKSAGSSAFSSLSNSADSFSGALAAVGLSYGALDVATAAWSGSTQAEFNKAYLATKMSSSAASTYISQIQQIVAAVPGDDTFMNQLITGALARQTSLSVDQLYSLGNAAADYMAVSQSMGKSSIETQMDLMEYITTGNTSQLQRDSILKNQLGTLENQATVGDRIKALQKGLNAEGYAGLANLDTASIKAETLKGKFQLAATSLGTGMLPYLKKAIDFILNLDDSTGGWSSKIAVIGTAVVGIVSGIGLMSGPLTSMVGLWKSIGEYASKLGGYIKDAVTQMWDYVTAAKAADAADNGVGVNGTGTSTSGGSSGSGSKGNKLSTILPIIGKTVGYGAGSLAAGNFISDYVAGPVESWLSNNFTPSGYTKATPSKGYHGILDLFGLGNTDYGVFGSNSQMKKNAEQYGASHDILKGNLSNWGPFGSVASWLGSTGGWAGSKLSSAGSWLSWLGQTGSSLAFSGKGISGSAALGNIGSWISAGLKNINLSSIGSTLIKSIPGLSGLSSVFSGLKGIDFSSIFKGLNLSSITSGITKAFANLIPGGGNILTIITSTIKSKIPNLKWPSLSGIAEWIKSKIPSLKWPSLSGISQWVQSKIPKINWNIPNLSAVSAWITSKIPHLSWNVPTLASVSSWIINHIGRLTFPSISWGSVAGWIQSHIGYLTFPSSGTISAWVQSAISKVTGGGPAGPAGPIRRTAHRGITAIAAGASGTIAAVDGFMSGFGYDGYRGHQKSIAEVIASGSGNCVDLGLTAMAYGSSLGLDTSMEAGTWNGGAHVWTQIGGKTRDYARKAISGTYQPPAAGPGSIGGDTYIVIKGDVYDSDKFVKKVSKAMGISTKSIRRM